MTPRELTDEEVFGAPPAAQPPAAPVGPQIDPDTDALVRTVWGEARNQSPEGRKAVAAVIRNRAQMTSRPIRDVVMAPGQFEPWGNPQTRQQLESLDPRSPEYQAILADVQTGDDPTFGATHFYAPQAQEALGRPPPAWDNGSGFDIGDHRFFRLPYAGEGVAPVGELSDEEVFGAAAAPPQAPEDTTVAEVVVEGARPGERERIFQPLRDFWDPVSGAAIEAGRDFKEWASGNAAAIRGEGGGGANLLKMGEVLLSPLAIAGGLAEGVMNQVTGPLGRLAARTPVPIYGPTAYGETPVPLEGEARSQAFTGALNTAASGARAAPSFGPPRPTIAATGGERRVAGAVTRAIKRDQMTLDEVLANLRQDPDLPAFQAAGENTRALADVLAQSPGEANTMLRRAARDSQATATDRVMAEAAKALGGQGDYFQTLDKLAEARRLEANQGMATIGQNPVRLDENAVQALRSERARAAIRERALNAQASPDPDERTAGARLFRLADDVLDNPGGVEITIRDAQDISRYLREEASAAYAGGDGGRGGALKSLATAVRDSAKSSSSEYGEWLKRYGDQSDNIEALELGRDVFRNTRDMNAERLRSTLSDMAPASLDFFRKGVGEAVVGEARASKGGPGAARQLLRSREFSDRVRLAFPDDDSFKSFMNALEREVRIQDRNTSIAGGSPTAYRQAARADLEKQGLSAKDALGAALDIGTGAPIAMTGKALKIALKGAPEKDRTIVGDPELNRLLGEILSDPEALKRALKIGDEQTRRSRDNLKALTRALLPLQATPDPQATTGP